MRKPVRSRGGFTLIEVVAATVLLVITASGFMMMIAANTKALAREQRIERSNYELSSLAQWSGGEPTGRVLTVEFMWEAGGVAAEELFEECSVSEEWEDMENSMTFYRHGLR